MLKFFDVCKGPVLVRLEQDSVETIPEKNACVAQFWLERDIGNVEVLGSSPSTGLWKYSVRFL